MIGIYGILEKAKERVTEGLRNINTIEVINGSSAANNIFLLLKWYEEDGV